MPLTSPLTKTLRSGPSATWIWRASSLTVHGRWAGWGLIIGRSSLGVGGNLLGFAEVVAGHGRVALADCLLGVEAQVLGRLRQLGGRALDLHEEAEVEGVEGHRHAAQAPARAVLREHELDAVAEGLEEVARRGRVGDLDLGLLPDLDAVLEGGRPLGRQDPRLAGVEDAKP